MAGIGRFRALFTNRAVTLFVTALVFTRIGDQFVAIGLLWVTLDLTHSATATGLVLMAFTSATIFAGFFAGSLLDRYPRKPLIIADNIVRVMCIGGVALAGISHVLSVVPLVLLVVIAAMAGAITVVAARAYLPSLVSEDLIVTVFAVDSSLYQVASIAGPALAGIVTASFGGSWALAAGAAFFALFVIVAAFIPAGALDAGMPPEAKPISMNEELRGARYIISHPLLRAVTVLTIISNFFFIICVVGLAFLSKDAFGLGAVGQGIMLAALAVGSLVASVMLGTGRWKYRRGPSLIAVNIIAGLLFIAVGVAPSIAVACVLLFAVGAVDAGFFIWMSELRQRTPPPELYARVISASMILNVISWPFASATAGFAVTAIHVRPMFVLAGGLLALYSLLFFRNAALRQAQ